MWFWLWWILRLERHGWLGLIYAGISVSEPEESVGGRTILARSCSIFAFRSSMVIVEPSFSTTEVSGFPFTLSTDSPAASTTLLGGIGSWSKKAVAVTPFPSHGRLNAPMG